MHIWREDEGELGSVYSLASCIRVDTHSNLTKNRFRGRLIRLTIVHVGCHLDVWILFKSAGSVYAFS